MSWEPVGQFQGCTWEWRAGTGLQAWLDGHPLPLVSPLDCASQGGDPRIGPLGLSHVTFKDVFPPPIHNGEDLGTLSLQELAPPPAAIECLGRCSWGVVRLAVCAFA